MVEELGFLIENGTEQCWLYWLYTVPRSCGLSVLGFWFILFGFFKNFLPSLLKNIYKK